MVWVWERRRFDSARRAHKECIEEEFTNEELSNKEHIAEEKQALKLHNKQVRASLNPRCVWRSQVVAEMVMCTIVRLYAISSSWFDRFDPTPSRGVPL